MRLIDFSLAPLSGARAEHAWRAIHPVAKAPASITGDGGVPMDASLIQADLAGAVPAGRRLRPMGADEFALAQSLPAVLGVKLQ